MRDKVTGIWLPRASSSAGDRVGKRVQGSWFPHSEDREMMAVPHTPLTVAS